MINSRDINKLHPTVLKGFIELRERVFRNPEFISFLNSLGLQVNGLHLLGVSSTFRDEASQNALFAQGRTTPGAIVTNARGGFSMHNHKLAFDIFLNSKGNEWRHHIFFRIVGEEWVKMGGVWGGNWTGFVDRPHFEWSNGLSISDLRNGKQIPEDAKMLWESEKKETINPMEEKIFNTLEQIKEERAWAFDSVQKWINLGVIQGDGAGLRLTDQMLRLVVMLERRLSID